MKIKINIEDITPELEKACKEALIRTGYSVIDDIENAQVVPIMRSTMIQTLRPLDTSEIDNFKVSIHSDTPYARRLYEHPEYNFHRGPWEIHHRDGSVERFPGNPNARGAWFEPWEKGKKKRWVVSTFKKHLKAVTK